MKYTSTTIDLPVNLLVKYHLTIGLSPRIKELAIQKLFLRDWKRYTHLHSRTRILRSVRSPGQLPSTMIDLTVMTKMSLSSNMLFKTSI